jgi:hypothetical protein
VVSGSGERGEEPALALEVPGPRGLGSSEPLDDDRTIVERGGEHVALERARQRAVHLQGREPLVQRGEQ